MKRRKIDAEAVSDIALQTYVPLLIDAEASESTAAEEEREEQKKSEREPSSGDSEEHEDDFAILPRSNRRRTRVICEDDEEGDIDKFEISMGMAQAFAATMADRYANTQTHEKANSDEFHDSLAFLGPTPESGFQAENLKELQQIIPDGQTSSTPRM